MRSSCLLVLLFLATGFFGPGGVDGHPQTRQRFLRQQQQRKTQVQPAPGTSEQECALTIDLSITGQRRPIAGNVRITLDGAEKPLELGELIQREGGWFAMPPRATIQLPSSKIKVEVLHGIQAASETR